MPQSEQNHTQQHAAGIDADIPHTGASAGDKNLNGFIHTGCQPAAEEGRQRALAQHTEQPAKAQA